MANRANSLIEAIAGIWGKGSDRVPKRRIFKVMPLAFFWYGSDKVDDDKDTDSGFDFGDGGFDASGDGGGGE